MLLPMFSPSAGAEQTDTGLVIAGAGASVDTGSSPAWGTPGNIPASDDSDATMGDSSAISSSDDLKGSSFGFAIATDATIDGFEVAVEGAGFGTVNIIYVTLGKDDSTLGTPLTPSQALTSSDAVYTFGGSAELFGLSWTPAEVNASTFQARIRVSTGGAFQSASIDAMWVRVYYTP